MAKSVKFPGCNLEIGKGQPEYYMIHALHVPSAEDELIMCFELSEEELQRVNETKRIYYSRLTFGQKCPKCGQNQGFQPMKLFTDLDDGIILTGTIE